MNFTVKYGPNPWEQSPTTIDFYPPTFYLMGGNGDLVGDACYITVEGYANSDLERLLDLVLDRGNPATSYEMFSWDVNQDGRAPGLADFMQLAVLGAYPDILCFNDNKFN